ncbi:SGNH/GDSL hydrolase family protein [Camelliibacillus cellulosilyticus]|uniref:SGNH/GDSL hydrolase family protein n=2 Tax=Camelliibacillus cellulosilyticus TaxID=2174486 RepID=A0ABV9GPI7_9BACL
MKKWMLMIIVVGLISFILWPAFFASSSDRAKVSQSFHQPALILAGIDSLTNGPLYAATKARYLDDFIPRIERAYGNGGPGYIPFDTRYFKQEGGLIGMSPGLREIRNIPKTSDPARFSFDLKGVFTRSGNMDNLTVQIPEIWHYGKIFYLIQPQGGSFEVGYAGDAHFERVRTDGSRRLGVLNLPVHQQKSQLVIKQIQGKVTLFGGYFYNSGGVIVSRVGQGGDRLAWYAGINHQMLKEWIAALQPNLFIFNGGMNDRRTLNATSYRKALDQYLNPFREADCQLILTMPNAILGDNRTLDSYDKVLRDYAEKYHTGLVSNKEVLGATFKLANKRHEMGDHIHPNASGSRKISENMYHYIMNHAEFRSRLQGKTVQMNRQS